LKPLLPAAAPWQAPLEQPKRARMGCTWLRKLWSNGLSMSTTTTVAVARPLGDDAVMVARPLETGTARTPSMRTIFGSLDA